MVHVVVVILVLTRRHSLGRGDKTASNDCKELVPAPGLPGVMYMTNGDGAGSLLHTVEGRATVTASCFSGSESVTPASGETSYFFFAFSVPNSAVLCTTKGLFAKLCQQNKFVIMLQ